MRSKERIKKAILFQGPDRIPVDLPRPWGSDFIKVSLGPDPHFRPKVKGEDEWGCIWEKLPDDKTMGQVKFHPLKDYSMLESFKFPNYDLPARYEQIKKIVSRNKEEKFILASIPFSLIHRLEYLRGHKKAWTDPHMHPESLNKLLDKLVDVATDSIKHLAKIGIDGIISADDWGLQDRLIFSPKVFRKFFKAKYAKVYKFAYEQGLFTFLHSCGYIIEILDDLIEAGLQVIQMDQQENMGIDELSKRFGGKICFWCPVDIQTTMIKGTAEDVKSYAKKLMDSFGKFKGGFIAGWYSWPEAIDHSQEKIEAMAKTFIEYGGRFYKNRKL